jgi:hypothetical protein
MNWWGPPPIPVHVHMVPHCGDTRSGPAAPQGRVYWILVGWVFLQHSDPARNRPAAGSPCLPQISYLERPFPQ